MITADALPLSQLDLLYVSWCFDIMTHLNTVLALGLPLLTLHILLSDHPGPFPVLSNLSAPRSLYDWMGLAIWRRGLVLGVVRTRAALAKQRMLLARTLVQGHVRWAERDGAPTYVIWMHWEWGLVRVQIISGGCGQHIHSYYGGRFRWEECEGTSAYGIWLPWKRGLVRARVISRLAGRVVIVLFAIWFRF